MPSCPLRRTKGSGRKFAHEREIVTTGAVTVEIAVSIVPRARVRLHAINDLGKPDDTAQQEGRRQPHSVALLDLIGRHVVGA